VVGFSVDNEGYYLQFPSIRGGGGPLNTSCEAWAKKEREECVT
jgi:hypothetical protein